MNPCSRKPRPPLRLIFEGRGQALFLVLSQHKNGENIMICDTLEHLNRYRGFHENLDTAIDYLTAYCVGHTLADLPLGRTEVDGENVFINVMEADLKPGEGANPEYHQPLCGPANRHHRRRGLGLHQRLPGEEVRGRLRGTSGFRTVRTPSRGVAGRGTVCPVLPRRAAQARRGTPGCARKCAKPSSRSEWRTEA